MTPDAAIDERKKTLRRAQKLLKKIQQLDAPFCDRTRRSSKRGLALVREARVALVRGLTTGISIGFRGVSGVNGKRRNVILSLFAIVVIGCVVSEFRVVLFTRMVAGHPRVLAA